MDNVVRKDFFVAVTFELRQENRDEANMARAKEETLWAEGLEELPCLSRLYEESEGEHSADEEANARTRACKFWHLPGIIRLTRTCSQGKEKPRG